MNFKPGTIFEEKGTGLVSKIIELLTSMWLSIPLKECRSHVCTAYDSSRVGSAEFSGYKIIDREPAQRKAIVVAWEFTDPKFHTPEAYKEIQSILDRKVGTKYNVWKYFLNPQRISLFYLAQLAIIGLLAFAVMKLFKVKTAIAMIPVDFAVTAICISLVLGYLFRAKEKGKDDCSDAEQSNHTDWGSMTFYGLGSPRNATPNHMAYVLANLKLHGKVKMVGYKPANGDWMEVYGE